MANNTRAIAAFYADGTYNLLKWADAKNLHDSRRYVGVAVYQVQGSPTPVVTTFTGHDVTSVRLADTVLMVRQADFPPWPAYFKQSLFGVDGTQVVGQDVPGPLELVMAGADVVLYTKDYDDPDYDAMTDRANVKAAELVSAAVPSSGTY